MSQSTATEKQPELKRAIGTKLLLLFIVGDILGNGCVCPDRTGGRRGRRRGLGSPAAGVHRGRHHRVLLSGVGDEVPAGGGRRAVHAQGLRDPFPHLFGDVRRAQFRHHVRLHRRQVFGRELHCRLQPGLEPDRGDLGGHHLHGGSGLHQLPRRQRIGQVQRGADPGGVRRPADRDRHRILGDEPGQCGLQPRDGLRNLE